MGQLSSSANLKDLILEGLVNTEKSDLKYERQKALLEQSANRDTLKKSLAEYRAGIGGQGISPTSGSASAVQKGMASETQKKNDLISLSFRQKLKQAQKEKQRKSLLAGKDYLDMIAKGSGTN